MPLPNQTFLIPKPSITNAFANNSLSQIRPGLNVENVTSFSTDYYENNNAVNWTPLTAPTTNIQEGSLKNRAAQLATSTAASLVGIPQVAQIGNSLIDSNSEQSIYSQYAVANVEKNTLIPGVKYVDFRSRKGFKLNEGGLGQRIDGAAATQRILLRGFREPGGLKFAVRTGAYAGAAATRFGAYSLFNREATYGWGDHDNPYALRNDFTAQSHVATAWRGGVEKKWKPTFNPLSVITPFRGDKVNVIDFGQRTLNAAYQWKPEIFDGGGEVFGAINEFFPVGGGITQDFIKFYLTGPSLSAGGKGKDDIIVFRASINSLTDTFGSNWNEVKLIGRADPNYQYSGYSRDISLDFTVFATDRDEVKPIWRKLNALAGYTAPQYDSQNIALVGSWLRITIGDLFVQQAAVIKSLNYTLYDAESPWEINIEGDPEMMQVPQKIDVSLSLGIVTDWLPQKNGRFYSLAQRYDSSGLPIKGTDNWLSDAKDNPPTLDIEQLKQLQELAKESGLTEQELQQKVNDIVNAIGPTL